MNLPFFPVKASYVPGGGPESGRKNFENCLPAGTGTKTYFSRLFQSLGPYRGPSVPFKRGSVPLAGSSVPGA